MPSVIINDRGALSIMLLATNSRKTNESKFIGNVIATIPFPVSIRVPVKKQRNHSHFESQV